MSEQKRRSVNMDWGTFTPVLLVALLLRETIAVARPVAQSPRLDPPPAPGCVLPDGPSTRKFCSLTEGCTNCDYYDTKCHLPPGSTVDRVKVVCAPEYTLQGARTNNPVVCFPGYGWYPSMHNCLKCGKSKGIRISPTIVDGKDALIGFFPWHAGLYYRQYVDGKISWIQKCGGTLITDRVVLTAAHCVAQVTQINDMRVALGKYRRSWDEQEATEQKRSVLKIVYPLEYNPNTLLSDIALLLLNEKITLDDYIMPVCRDYGEGTAELRGGKTYVVGWGKTTSLGEVYSEKLLYNTISTMPGNKCSDKLPFYFSTHEKLCAYKNTSVPESVTYKGDSGGGLTVVYPDGLHYIAGVISTRVENVSLFTNIKYRNHRQWIDKEIAKFDNRNNGTEDLIDSASRSRFNFFDGELLQSVARDVSGDFAISPASVKGVLGLMLEKGSVESQTGREITTLLRLPEDWMKTRQLISSVRSSLQPIGAQVYIKRDEDVDPGYVKAYWDRYDFKFSRLDFKIPADIVNITNNVTNPFGTRFNLLEPRMLNSEIFTTVMVAVAFYNPIREEFVSDTKEECFYSEPSFTCTKVPIMNINYPVNYRFDWYYNSHILDLPDQNKRFSMVLVVPAAHDGSRRILPNLNRLTFPSLLDGMTKTEVRLKLPRFSTETGIELKKTLIKMGMKTTFTGRPGMPFVTKQWPVPEIFQAVKMIVNVTGTKAGPDVVPPFYSDEAVRVTANRPFFYFFYDTKEGNVLISGRISTLTENTSLWQNDSN